MNTTNTSSAAAGPKPAPRSPRGSRQAQQMHLAQISSEARKKAAAVLEVLAGVRTPTQAAQALGLALPGYYHLEVRALQGLMAGCEPLGRGRQRCPQRELSLAQQQCRKLTMELQRYQSLARAAQRTVGLVPPPVPKKPEPGKRMRKPAVRALQAIALIKEPPEAVSAAVTAAG
jgi:hypothetical protein